MSRHKFLDAPLRWPWPAMATHHGVPLGNGTFGALIWGEGLDLRCTINRQDYWDHRGGVRFGPEATYANLKQWLYHDNEAELRRVFEGLGADQPGVPPRPTRLPMGRVDVRLSGEETVGAEVDLATGEARFLGASGSVLCRASLLRSVPVLALRLAAAATVVGCPPDAPEVREYFEQYGLGSPQPFAAGQFAGWTQECPGEPALCVAWLRVARAEGTDLLIAGVFGDGPDGAVAQARSLLEDTAQRPYETLAQESADWWQGYWEQTAAVDLPDPDHELLYYLALYKLAGLSVPGGPAATLQGPWVEEYRMPPWSADYHFNINVQECYWPAFGANHVESLEPLLEMLRSWEPLLREQARAFVGVEDGFQLAHAVDDRGTGMGGFWTGAIDHGSTAWTGQLMWLYYRYTMDEGFLRETAYPFLKGAMRVYEAMLERDGDHWRLPVSVSPEFGGAGTHAWGRNASFQLAIIHFLCRKLAEASEKLGIDAQDRKKWRDLDRGLPLGSLSPDGSQLYLWEGQPLSESHRHHSHLAGIYPFDIFDLDREGPEQSLVRTSMQHLTQQGMGLWSGWCVPWASILFARLGNGDMADLLLEVFRRVFLGPGLASLHDAAFPGFTLLAGRPEIMQIEAGMGAAAAVLEMLVHTRGGVLRVFPAIPRDWPDVSFEGLRAEGAFLVAGERRGGRTVRVRVKSLAGERLVLANPWPESGAVRAGSDERLAAPVLEIPTTSGEELVLTPAD